MSVVAVAFGQRRMMTLIVLVGAAFILFFPARQLAQQHREIGGLEHRLSQLRAENDELESQVTRLQDPSELEVLARERLGLVRPGERAYFVEPVEPEPTPEATTERRPAWWERSWEWFTSLIRGGD